MLTGIIGAMAVETEAIKALIDSPVVEKAGNIEFVRGKLCGEDVVVAQCGIGKVFAAICAEAMILKYAPDRIINTGVAGTLSDKVGLLDIAVSSFVVEHDMDTSPLGDPVGLISGINIVNIPASEALVAQISAAAERLGKKCTVGVIASGDQFIADKTRKNYIRDTFSAIACEMEGAAIGHVCYVNGVDFAVIRCISDNADDHAGAMDYPTLCQKAAEQSQALLTELLRKAN